MFKSGGGKDADILKENEGQILFYVDLENESIIEKSDKKEGDQQEDDLENEVEGTKHPLLLN